MRDSRLVAGITRMRQLGKPTHAPSRASHRIPCASALNALDVTPWIGIGLCAWPRRSQPSKRASGRPDFRRSGRRSEYHGRKPPRDGRESNRGQWRDGGMTNSRGNVYIRLHSSTLYHMRHRSILNWTFGIKFSVLHLTIEAIIVDEIIRIVVAGEDLHLSKDFPLPIFQSTTTTGFTQM